MNVGELIKTKRQALGITQKQIAEYVGVSEGTVSRWESGNIGNMRRDRIAKLAEILHVSPTAIMGVDDESAPEEDSAYKKRIPILGTVVAGNPQYAYQDIEGWEEIDTRYAPYKTGEFFALTVKGSSMSPRMEEGDVIIVRVQDYIRAGEIAVVVIGDEATVKEVREAPDGDGICLVGANVAVYKPHLYSRNDIESEGMRICGKVVEMRRRF